MNPFVKPPVKIPLLLRPLIYLSEKIAGKRLLPARVLAWSLRISLGAGLLESLIEKEAQVYQRRLMRLVRLQVSFSLACSFCIDTNSFRHEKDGVSFEEILAIRDGDFLQVSSFSYKERLVLTYARQISETPVKVDPLLVEKIKAFIPPKKLVTIAALAAKVNYWARLIQALGIPPAGYMKECLLPLKKKG